MKYMFNRAFEKAESPIFGKVFPMKVKVAPSGKKVITILSPFLISLKFALNASRVGSKFLYVSLLALSKASL
jgi:hypothetical protein